MYGIPTVYHKEVVFVLKNDTTYRLGHITQTVSEVRFWRAVSGNLHCSVSLLQNEDNEDLMRMASDASVTLGGAP
jgi:hypothetical protein